ncbi:toxin-activating lysine-acyltransferase [uncultured Algimonas sp.]|uniref:toxin-activating lysine-acyltransferase n=1 Tax=uncultured Algimonas sp. TaxID=1547920 RepID=UPI00262EE0EE|nr:toxin-activating lysine-acyltransferase [uncultured Algimonas sp.]
MLNQMDKPKAAPPQEERTVSHVLGEITWLMTQSSTHKGLFLSDLEWMVMPPVLLEQFRIFYGPESPAAVAFWARVSEETDQRLRKTQSVRLRADEWKGGDIPWLIELVAPFGAEEEILQDLSNELFNGQEFFFHMTGNNGRQVRTFGPEGLKDG